MKKLTSIFAVLFLMTLSVNVFAQNSATVSNANASAKIISKITLAQTTPLNFGTIAQTSAAGSVVITPSSDVADYTNYSNGEIPSSTETRALFTVTGEIGATYSILLPTADVTLTRATGSETMTLSDFATVNAASNTLTNGTSTFNVGATLNIGANQVAGTYNGTYAVTVNYN